METLCKIRCKRSKRVFIRNCFNQICVYLGITSIIGKSSIVEQFAKELDLECVALLGSQLAAEDLIGIPQIKGDVSKFIPPSLIVRNKPFCLFIDELNIGLPEIQKAFYSLILNQRIN